MKLNPKKAKEGCENRNSDCPYSGGCLDYVIAHGWKGFSCSRCKYRTLKPEISIDDDFQGYWDLVAEIFRQQQDGPRHYRKRVVN